MIRLNRTTEYGLIALRHMSRKGGGGISPSVSPGLPPSGSGEALTSAREIADHYGLPFEITAKTLLRLKDAGMIQSAQGARGGYTLMRSLEEVTLREFLVMMEGPQSVVACATAPESKGEAPKEAPSAPCHCEYSGRCEIKGVMSDLNDRVSGFLGSIRLADLASRFLTSPSAQRGPTS
jgi:Rrf2 family protein